MAISIVQTTTASVASEGSTFPITFAANTTAGNAVVVLIFSDNTHEGTPTAGSETWHNDSSTASTNNSDAEDAWSALNIAGGWKTITFPAATGDNIVAIAWELSGLATSSAFDGASTLNNTFSFTNPITSGNLTTTNANDILFGLGFDNNGSNSSTWSLVAGQGWSGLIDPTPQAYVNIAVQTKIVSSTGTYASEMTDNYVSPYGFGMIYAYKAAAGGGGSTPEPKPIRVVQQAVNRSSVW